MFAKLFGRDKMFGMLLVYVVDGLVEEVSGPIYFHCIQRSVGGVLWARDMVGCGGSYRFGGFVVLSGVLDNVAYVVGVYVGRSVCCM